MGRPTESIICFSASLLKITSVCILKEPARLEAVHVYFPAIGSDQIFI